MTQIHDANNFSSDVNIISGSHCRLLQLPAELRNQIYSYTLISEDAYRIQLRSLHPPALLATCHQIHNEASSIFFSENKFVLTIVISPFAYNPANTEPLIHEVPIPQWIKTLEQTSPLHMRNVKIEIDHAFKWVVVTMARSGCRMRVVEAWLHNGRQQLPLQDMGERVRLLLNWTLKQKVGVDQNDAGLSYREVILVAAKMLSRWAGTIVPV